MLISVTLLFRSCAASFPEEVTYYERNNMNNNNDTNTLSLRERIISDMKIPDDLRLLMLSILDGNALVPLTTDIMAKNIFSPDIHPDRFDFLLQRIMQDTSLASDGSATNEPPLDGEEAKRLIFDLTAWLRDNRYADIEFQQVAQEFIFNRVDLHSSRILMLQYSAAKKHKSEVSADNVNGAIVIVLMKDSPDIFKNYKSSRYIHRIKCAVSDTGMEFPLLRQIAFVQLDKALEQFITKTYNEDEDLELLALLAMIADINNRQVYDSAKDNKFFKSIYEDAEKFSQDKEVQLMTFENEMDQYFFNLELGAAEKKGEEKGAEKALTRINALNAWLMTNNRADDVLKSATDSEYQDKLLAEYESQEVK